MKSLNSQNSMKKVHLFLLAGLSLWLVACATPYPEAIRGEQPVVSFQEVTQDIEAAAGRYVRWGGLLAKVENEKDFTRLEIVHLDTKKSGRPVVEVKSAGRFRVHVPGFLDPELYVVGRLISVYGALAQPEDGKIGEYDYQFPVVESEGVHIWSNIESTPQVDVMLHYGYGSYPYGYYHRPPFYTHPYYYPRPRPRPSPNTLPNKGSVQGNTPTSHDKSAYLNAPAPDNTERYVMRKQL